MDPDDDPRFAAFVEAGRRRMAITYFVLGVVAIVGGAVALAFLLQPGVDLDNANGRRQGAGYQLIVVAAGAIVVGLVLFVMGVKAWRDHSK